MRPTSPAGRRPAAAGFTLIELLVVLVIVAAVAPAFLAGPGNQAKLKASALTLASELRLARVAAIGRAGTADVVIDTRALAFGPGGAPGRHRLPAGVGVTVTTPAVLTDEAGRQAIRFYGNGRSSGGMVRLVGPASDFTVTVHWLSGRVVVTEARHET
jgi:prepilin-type N-terminal cleavage/methylation domain-containing protein